MNLTTLGEIQHREPVLAAIAEFDRRGRESFLAEYGFGPATRWYVVHNGRFYDSKALIGAAHGYEFPAEGPLGNEDFSGGDQTKSKLRSLRFQVVELAEWVAPTDSPLRDLLAEVAQTYDRKLDLKSSAQLRLRAAGHVLDPLLPPGYTVQGSGGKGVPTFTPWIGVFDPDETDSPQHGIYVVYLFSESLDTVALSLNQGIEDLRKAVGDGKARHQLAADAAAIRDAIPREHSVDLSPSLDLDSLGQRQRAYESGNIFSITYSTSHLAPDGDLRDDLQRFLGLYGRAIAGKRTLLLTKPGSVASSTRSGDSGVADPLHGFKPKDESDYTAFIGGRILQKSRKHERLVRQYGEWAGDHGFTVATPHPRDLTLGRNGSEWLVEAKVVYSDNATEAVRSAIGQLLCYRHFLYDFGNSPSMVALFNEPVGRAYIDFLEALGIASVWREQGTWSGSETAERHGLC